MQRTPSRLAPEDWLQEGLDLLLEVGASGIRIEDLAERLGVTTGSLYWHFEDRADLLRQMARHWAKQWTERYARGVAGAEGSPQERLLELMRALLRTRASRYDLAMRAWAAYSPAAARSVARVDRRRAEIVGGLFRAMGFRGTRLDARTHLVVTYESGATSIRPRLSLAERERLLVERHRILVDPN